MSSYQFSRWQPGGAVLLPVSYLMSLYSSKSQNLHTNQISSTYLDSRLKYNYIRFGKTNGSFLLVATSIVIGVLFCIRLPNFVQIGPCTGSRVMASYTISRWRPQRLIDTFGLVLVDVTVFGATLLCIGYLIVTTMAAERPKRCVCQIRFPFPPFTPSPPSFPPSPPLPPFPFPFSPLLSPCLP